MKELINVLKAKSTVEEACEREGDTGGRVSGILKRGRAFSCGGV